MLNLVRDPWIPMRHCDGTVSSIAPWQIANPDFSSPAWPRADLNLACWELLIGLVYLADPPRDADDWEARRAPDPERLRALLDPFASAFELLGDGPRFLQETAARGAAPNPVDMLFIDSAGGNTAKKNADLFVRRDRYDGLDLAIGAMALHALQQQAPSGGAGNRTSMRGGGPLVTLVDPGRGLWDTVWANVPDGAPSDISDLPWMRGFEGSKAKGAVTAPRGQGVEVECFFGMPRRLWLEDSDGRITGVRQVPWGRNYTGFEHPLSPYYRAKEGDELLPVHPRPRAFGYRDWEGVVLRQAPDGKDTRRRARCVEAWSERGGFDAEEAEAGLIVGGWAMDNMKPRTFHLSQQPLMTLSAENETRLLDAIRAADLVRVALRGALGAVAMEGERREVAEEAFISVTEGAFLDLARGYFAGADREVLAGTWRTALRRQALDIFDRTALPGLDRVARPEDAAEAVRARGRLVSTLEGYGKSGRDLFDKLRLPPPDPKAKKEVPA